MCLHRPNDPPYFWPVVVLTMGSSIPPATIRLYSQYQENSSAIPPNYHFVKHLPLTNKYWWPTSQYSYYIFVNENANPTLINDLRGISIDDIDKEMGYQKYIFRSLEMLARLEF
jgi:hypothetical protein